MLLFHLCYCMYIEAAKTENLTLHRKFESGACSYEFKNSKAR